MGHAQRLEPDLACAQSSCLDAQKNNLYLKKSSAKTKTRPQVPLSSVETTARTLGLSAKCLFLRVTALLNFSASHPVSWPTPPSTAVPAVTPVAPVQPAQGAGRDPQAGLGNGQNRQSANQSKDRSDQQGAPILPRETDASTPGQDARARESGTGEQRAVQEAAARAAEQRAKDKEEIYQRLREVLSNVWQASAAVVDRALERDAASETSGPPGGGTASGLTTVATLMTARRPMLSAPLPVSPPIAQATPVSDSRDALPGAGQNLPTTDVVAYDERGNGSAPLREAGRLVDQRV